MTNKEQALEMAEIVSRSIKTIELQNHMIDFADSSKKDMTTDDVLVQYAYLTRALETVFELNQSMVNDLEKAAVHLYDSAEEAETDESN